MDRARPRAVPHCPIPPANSPDPIREKHKHTSHHPTTQTIRIHHKTTEYVFCALTQRSSEITSAVSLEKCRLAGRGIFCPGSTCATLIVLAVLTSKVADVWAGWHTSLLDRPLSLTSSHRREQACRSQVPFPPSLPGHSPSIRLLLSAPHLSFYILMWR